MATETCRHEHRSAAAGVRHPAAHALARAADPGVPGPPLLVSFLTGLAILGAAFVLSWAAELLQMDVSQCNFDRIISEDYTPSRTG
jgi:hypothetical protein